MLSYAKLQGVGLLRVIRHLSLRARLEPQQQRNPDVRVGDRKARAVSLRQQGGPIAECRWHRKKGERLMKTAMVATVCAVMASAASAGDMDWKYSLTAYLWTTKTGVSAETPTGETVEAELSFSDALQDLDFAFMGAFEARKGKLSLFTDGMYFKLSPTNDTPGPITDSVTVRSQMTVISGYAAYRVYDDPSVAVDLAGGFRWASLDSDVKTTGPLTTEFNSSDDWIDPVIGVRLSTQLSEKVSAALFVDYGGFSSESSTWQTAISVGYALNESWTLRGGYRYMEFDREIDGRDFSLDQSGLLLGATYSF
jgi:opacity protein-like surface antigen